MEPEPIQLIDPLPEPQSGVPLKILIIDDEPADREIFKQFLDADRPGIFQFAESPNGSDGLRRMDLFQPDCILLDFNLPDLDGLKMIRLLRDGKDLLPCAIVMLTALGNEKIAVEAMKLGVMDYMPKGPASAHGLPRTVASAVQRFRFQQEIARQRVALEQRNAELEATRNELYEEKERYRVLAEAIPQLVWTADSSGGIHYGNQRLWDFIGPVDRRFWALENLLHPDDHSAFRQQWRDAVRSGGPFETELRLQCAKDQTWRWHLMRTVPLRGPEGGPVLWFGTFTDIEQQKRAEESLRRQEKLDSIALLAGGIAHDFNNLLAGIMGGASFALDNLPQEHPAYPMLEIVLRSSERAAFLTRQLLAYSGQVEVWLEETDIESIVREACAQTRAQISDRIRLDVATAGKFPLIQSNAAHMQQVLVNLLTNAVEAIGESHGVITVTLSMKFIGASPTRVNDPNVLGYELPPGEYVCLEVADNGPGIEKELLTQIFDPFFTTKFTGRGLGLAVVQGVVRSLHGGIHVTSEPGTGSRFTVLLPPRRQAANSSPGISPAEAEPQMMEVRRSA